MGELGKGMLLMALSAGGGAVGGVLRPLQMGAPELLEQGAGGDGAGMVRALRAQRSRVWARCRVRASHAGRWQRAGRVPLLPPHLRSELPSRTLPVPPRGAGLRAGSGRGSRWPLPRRPDRAPLLTRRSLTVPLSWAPVRRRSARAAVPERPRVAMLPAWLRLCLAALLLPPGAAAPPACPAQCRCPEPHILRCREPRTVSSLSALLLGTRRLTDV